MFANIGKAYDTVEEEAHALDNFIANEKIILEHNSGNSTFVLGHNEFSDLSRPEFKNTYTSGLVKSTVAKVSGYSDAPQGSESGVKSSIAQEPTSMAIKVDKSVFQLCKPGVGDFDSTQIFDSAHDLHPNICLQTYLLPILHFC